MFRLNFDDFSGLGPTGAGKIEIRARMIRFCHLKYTHSIWDAFLVVSHPYG